MPSASAMTTTLPSLPTWLTHHLNWSLQQQQQLRLFQMPKSSMMLDRLRPIYGNGSRQYILPGSCLRGSRFCDSHCWTVQPIHTAAVVPQQWKTARITPVPKVAKPVQPSEFRPISITPVLSRLLERHIVNWRTSIRHSTGHQQVSASPISSPLGQQAWPQWHLLPFST